MGSSPLTIVRKHVAGARARVEEQPELEGRRPRRKDGSASAVDLVSDER